MGSLMCLPAAAAWCMVSVMWDSWATTTGSSLILGPEIDAPSQEKANKAAWNVSSVRILFCAA